jgi:hypothetical protein
VDQNCFLRQTSSVGKRLQDPLDMKLIHVSSGHELEDAKTLLDHKVQNDDIIGLCYKKETSSGARLCQRGWLSSYMCFLASKRSLRSRVAAFPYSTWTMCCSCTVSTTANNFVFLQMALMCGKTSISQTRHLSVSEGCKSMGDVPVTEYQ